MTLLIRSLAPWAVGSGLILLWAFLCRLGIFHASALPTPSEVFSALLQEIRVGRMFSDVNASLFRVMSGFCLSSAVGISVGILMGRSRFLRAALLPFVNFFRNLSPLAWMPFAILWFGVGDVPVVFLIFVAGVFPITLATLSAVDNVPQYYFRIAHELGMSASEILWKITFPAILPQTITSMRVTAGICWLVLVAAEMIAGRDGLGYAVIDARNGLRTDILIAEMIVIGAIGIVIDRGLYRLSAVPSVRWSYEQ